MKYAARNGVMHSHAWEVSGQYILQLPPGIVTPVVRVRVGNPITIGSGHHEGTAVFQDAVHFTNELDVSINVLEYLDATTQSKNEQGMEDSVISSNAIRQHYFAVHEGDG